MMNRRRFLGHVAAAAALPLVGCRSGGLQARMMEAIPGRILGASSDQGHLLRTQPPTFKQGERRKVAVAIVGAGIAGLSAAWKLTRSGLDDCRIFELEHTAGGNSRAHTYPESKAPWGAHYLPVPTQESTAVRELLSEMGLLDGYTAQGAPRYSELELCHEPQERTFVSGFWEEGTYPKWGANREDLKQWDDFNKRVGYWQSWRDKSGRKAFAIPIELSSHDPQVLALDGLSMADYMLKQGWTSPRLRYFVEYGCRDDYGTSLELTSAWAGLHYFASRDGGGFTPRDSQFVWPEGNQRIVQHFLGVLGASRLSSGMLLTRVAPTPQGVLLDLLDTATGEVHGWQAQHCIYALPTYLRPFLLGEAPRPAFTYAPWAIANLVLDALPRELPKIGLHSYRIKGEIAPKLCWDNVIYGSSSLGYVVATHQDLRTRDGPTVLSWYRPFTGSDPRLERTNILARDWASWRDEILNELSPIHPGLVASVRRLDVMLLGHAMIRPLTGFIWGRDRPQAARPQPPIYFAHSDLSGISIFEEAQFAGVRAAQELMADLKHPFHDSLGLG